MTTLDRRAEASGSATAPTTSASATVPALRGERWWRREWALYLAQAALTSVVTVVMLRLWRAVWSVPFFYSSDTVASAAHVKALFEWGWYEEQPDLGAPSGQHYHEYPFSDDLHLVLLKAVTPFTNNWVAAFNAYYVLGFVLAGLTALWFLRREGVSRSLALVAATLFAVAPYHFWRNEMHYFLAAYWTVPLGLVVVMTALRGEPLWGRGGRAGVLGLVTGPGAATVALLVVTGTATAYYAVFTAVLLAVAGVVGIWRTRSWGRFCGVVVAGGVLVVAVGTTVLPDWLYARTHDSNPLAASRAPDGAEVWALKLTSLLLPAPGHPVPALAALREEYDSSRPLPSESPALGIVCAVTLVVVLVWSLGRIAGAGARRDPVSSTLHDHLADLSLVTVVVLLLSTVGGVGSLMAYAAANVRGWNRISIVLSLVLLAVTGLLLDALATRLRRRMGGRPRRTVGTLIGPVLAAALLVVGVADQQVAGSVPAYTQTGAAWDSDAVFVRGLEATVPNGAMLFQLPFIAFPENGPVFDAGDTDLLKLSLHSTSLRWSLGGMKGRPSSDWGWLVVQKPPAQVVEIVTRMGFAGIVVDRNATPDHGARIEADYAPLTGAPALVSGDQRWSFLDLRTRLAAVQASSSPQERAAFTDHVLTRGP